MGKTSKGDTMQAQSPWAGSATFGSAASGQANPLAAPQPQAQTPTRGAPYTIPAWLRDGTAEDDPGARTWINVPEQANPFTQPKPWIEAAEKATADAVANRTMSTPQLWLEQPTKAADRATMFGTPLTSPPTSYGSGGQLNLETLLMYIMGMGGFGGRRY